MYTHSFKLTCIPTYLRRSDLILTVYQYPCIPLTAIFSFYTQHFHDVAYNAVCKEDFLDAMDKFLDDSIVLPPGDWDEELLLPIMHERNELRRRKREGVRV